MDVPAQEEEEREGQGDGRGSGSRWPRRRVLGSAHPGHTWSAASQSRQERLGHSVAINPIPGEVTHSREGSQNLEPPSEEHRARSPPTAGAPTRKSRAWELLPHSVKLCKARARGPPDPRAWAAALRGLRQRRPHCVAPELVRYLPARAWGASISAGTQLDTCQPTARSSRSPGASLSLAGAIFLSLALCFCFFIYLLFFFLMLGFFSFFLFLSFLFPFFFLQAPSICSPSASFQVAGAIFSLFSLFILFPPISGLLPLCVWMYGSIFNTMLIECSIWVLARTPKAKNKSLSVNCSTGLAKEVPEN